MPRPNRQLSEDKYSCLRARFRADDANYNLLNSTHPVFGRRGVWDGDYARQQYLRSVDHLIGLLDGTITKPDLATPGAVHAKPDVVVWLDKSARPASWIVDAFWDQIATEGSQRPLYEFVRIDRRDWLIHMGYTDTQARNASTKKVDVQAVPNDLILRLRALFCAEPVNPAAPTTLDGLHVLVVDETMPPTPPSPVPTFGVIPPPRQSEASPSAAQCRSGTQARPATAARSRCSAAVSATPAQRIGISNPTPTR